MVDNVIPTKFSMKDYYGDTIIVPTVNRTYTCDYCGKQFIMPNDMYLFYKTNPSLSSKFKFCTDECKRNYHICNSQRVEHIIQMKNDGVEVDYYGIIDDSDEIISLDVEYTIDDIQYISNLEFTFKKIIDCNNGSLKRGIVNFRNIPIDNSIYESDIYLSVVPSRVIFLVLKDLRLMDQLFNMYKFESHKKNINVVSKIDDSYYHNRKYSVVLNDGELGTIITSKSYNIKSFNCNMPYVYPLLKAISFDDDRSVNIVDINRIEDRPQY